MEISQLNEDEAIKILKKITPDDLLNCWEGGEKEFEAIETILDLYQQEKEKNKELEENQNRLAFKTNQYMNDVLSNNIVSKDKIKAKIKELEKRDYWNYDEIRVLKELLEEE